MDHRRQVRSIFEEYKNESLEYDTFSSKKWIENEKERIKNNPELITRQHRFLTRVLTDINLSKVVDFGGSLGSAYDIVRRQFKDSDFLYTVVETKEVCQAGKALHDNDRVRFVESIDDISNKDVDVVYVRTALQYAKNWKDTLRDLLLLEPKIVLLEHLSAGNIKSFRALQVYYDKKIPYWFIGIDELVSYIETMGYLCVLSEPCEKLDESMYSDSITAKRRLSETIRLVLRRE